MSIYCILYETVRLVMWILGRFWIGCLVLSWLGFYVVILVYGAHAVTVLRAKGIALGIFGQRVRAKI